MKRTFVAVLVITAILATAAATTRGYVATDGHGGVLLGNSSTHLMWTPVDGFEVSLNR